MGLHKERRRREDLRQPLFEGPAQRPTVSVGDVLVPPRRVSGRTADRPDLLMAHSARFRSHPRSPQVPLAPQGSRGTGHTPGSEHSTGAAYLLAESLPHRSPQPEACAKEVEVDNRRRGFGEQVGDLTAVVAQDFGSALSRPS